ncbi:SMI1/KNR4 family protein [Cytobacillus firmus]|uniref:SMI1/KNR4 family protein n=3 Tax=Cytobacillus firmus TaxID=1399 RepID=UPI001F50C32F|nr:SMI1/KNR4 family protein [Cytobacillus firmus]MBG9548597.1 hypothetical protein [Cytobacillus firmus]MBG9601644.1 hypothetical protein [Cytobacillus firmus]
MADFEFINELENKTYKVPEDDILKAEQRMDISFPNDLKQLYLDVGYGFIKGQSANAINRILGPGAVADIRLREGIFEFDPDLDELFDDEDKLIFFEVNEGVYISIDLLYFARKKCIVAQEILQSFATQLFQLILPEIKRSIVYSFHR